MKKYGLSYVLVLLSFCIYLPIKALNSFQQIAINRVDQIKSRLNKEVDEIKKCVKRGQNCDPLRKKIYLTIATIGSLLITAATGTTIYLVKKKKKIRRTSQETTALEKPTSPSEISSGFAQVQELGKAEDIESEGEEEYFSAEESDDEGFESAEDEPAQEEKLKKTISTYETTYRKQYNLLNSSITVPHAGGRFIEDKKLKEDIQKRQREGELYYQQSINTTDLEEKLNLLKKALDKLRGR